MRKFLLFLLIAPIFSFGQTIDNYNFDYSKLIHNDVENNNFKNDSIADGELKKILSIVGNPNRFVVKSNDNVQNALAISYRGLRFILFNKEFINQTINITNNYWTNTFILAHEVGHHLNRHLLESKEKKNNNIRNKKITRVRSRRICRVYISTTWS